MPATGNYCYIPKEQKQLVVKMSVLRGMTTKDIASATGIATRTIRRLLSQWVSTGEPVSYDIVVALRGNGGGTKWGMWGCSNDNERRFR